MKILHWISSEPPEGFEFGPTPTDFGVGRAAYSRDHFGQIDQVIYRGDYIIQHNNGTIERVPLFTGLSVEKLISLLAEANITVDNI